MPRQELNQLQFSACHVAEQRTGATQIARSQIVNLSVGGSGFRVPAKHLSDTGRFGSCKATLPPVSEPVDVDATAFAAITREAKVPVLVDF